MSYVFGDSFDFYNVNTDILAGYWDGGGMTNNFIASPGRFGGRCWQILSGAVPGPFKNGANDAVHHINCAMAINTIVANTNVGFYITLSDGITAQCSIGFRGDGTILLTSGGPTGTTLATFTGAVQYPATWIAFEFEVVINNASGSFTVRRNGNPSNDFSATGLNTRGGTTNNYASRLTIGSNTAVSTANIDDLLWRSDATSVPWAGDVRAYVRMPTTDASTQFAKSPTSTSLTPFAPTATPLAVSNTSSYYMNFTPTYDGTISSVTVPLVNGYTGSMKCSIFAYPSNAALGAVLASATNITNPITGNNVFTFPTAVNVTKGTPYYVGVISDTSSGNYARTVGANGFSYITTYAAFPVANASLTSPTGSITPTILIATGSNATLVNEAQQDGTTSYVYDATVGHADFYAIASQPNPVASILAVTTRAFMEKSDAGTRTGAVQLKSGAVTTTWNPSDQVNTTLSGGNLVATFTGTTTNSGVRSIFSATTGKYYMEFRCNVSSNSAAGIGLGSINLGNQWPVGGTAGSSTVSSSFLLVGTTIAANMGASMSNGDVLQMAVDLTAKLIWFRINAAANWNGNFASSTGNPSTGVGGVDISSISTGALYAMCGGQQNAVFTANFGGSAFVYPVPGGFAGAFGGTGTTVTSPAVGNSTFTAAWRTDTTDPNTGAAWTAAAVDAVQIGAAVIS